MRHGRNLMHPSAGQQTSAIGGRVRHPRRISAHAKWLFFHPDITMQKSWIPLKNSGAGDIGGALHGSERKPERY
jgi:hypothetical protein